MSELSLLNFKKRKDGRWECYDHFGHAAIGLTKQAAENQYNLLYKMNRNNGINLDQYKYKLGE